ncbi:MAG: hypothetical protein WD847_18495 [Pirellulales bacterium]
MTPRCWVWPLLLLAAPGCRAAGNVELLERELRWQEDRIYELEKVVDEYTQQLESCQRENKSLLSDDEDAALPRREGAGTRDAAPRRRQPASDDDSLAPPEVILPGDDQADPFQPPEIMPPGTGPEGQHSPADGPRPNESQSQLEHDPGADQAPSDSAVVAGITLNPRLTGGHNVDGQAGDEGVMVVIEPRDADGDLVEAAGDVSVVVLDPAQRGQAARVARWDFTAEEAAGHLRDTPMGNGLHFELRWPHGPPAGAALTLYVRFTTSDGRKLEVEKQIGVDPPGVPSDNRTRSAAASGPGRAESLPRIRATGPRPIDGQHPPAATRSGPSWPPYR